MADTQMRNDGPTVRANALCPKVGVFTVSSPAEVGADRGARLCVALVESLSAEGCTVIDGGVVDSAAAAVRCGRAFAAAGIDAAVVGVACWFEDYLVLDFLEECRVPLLFRPLPGMETGALCGTQQACCYLKQLGVPCASAFGELDDSACRTRTRSFVRAAGLHGRLRRARIGLAGMRVPGMTEVAVNEIALKRAAGPRVVPVDLAGLLRAADVAPADETARVWQAVREGAGDCRVSDDAGLRGAAVYLAIRDLVLREGLAGLAFGCYPDYMGCACLAASLLADEGVPVGCEGDVNSTVGQVILSLLTGGPTHNADWLDPLPDGSVVLTHCGSGSHRLAARPGDVILAPVRLAHRGVCSLFSARPGPVTLLSLLPVGDGYRFALLEGEAVPVDPVFPGNPLRVRFPRGAGDILEWIAASGIGHHWAAGYGLAGSEIRDWARIAGPPAELVEIG